MGKYDISTFGSLSEFSKRLFLNKSRVFLLSGDLGSGKTTFVANFIKENLLKEEEKFDALGVMSPTFSIINEYQTLEHSVVHADFYRLKKNDFEEEEFLQIVGDADYTFIEWPSKLNLLDVLNELFDVVSLEFRIDVTSGLREVYFKQL